MNINSVSLILFITILSACSIPVPENKSAYIGEWQSKEMYLLILQDGTVSYKRLKNGDSTSVNGPLKEFIGDDFVVGFSFLTTTFDVSEPPVKDSNTWRMTIDGIRLQKTEQ